MKTYPYDTLLWSEAGACDGLTGVVAATGQNHNAAGDKLTLKSTPKPPVLMGLGSVSDTKPQGCALIPDDQKAALPIPGPGAIDFWGKGWDKSLRELYMILQKGDKLTGQISNTNVNEGSLVAADIVYGLENIPPPIDLRSIRGQLKAIHRDLFSITSANAVTFNDAAAELKGLLTYYKRWYNPDKEYYILGFLPSIAAATFGGIVTFTNLGGNWQGRQPGICMNPLSAVVFNPGAGPATPLSPIPFSDTWPTAGIDATSAGAITCPIIIGEGR